MIDEMEWFLRFGQKYVKTTKTNSHKMFFLHVVCSLDNKSTE